MKALAVIALCATFTAAPTFAADLSDADAKVIAQRMERLVQKSLIMLNIMIKTDDFSAFPRLIMQPLATANRQWPDKNLSGRAIFPYGDCATAAADLSGYGTAFWMTSGREYKRTAGWREDQNVTAGYFKKDFALCKEDLKHPDMSLKNIH